MHFLHGQTGLRRLGELHIADTFWLFCLLVFDHPNPLNVSEHRETLPEFIFGYGPAGNREKPTVWRVVEVFYRLFRRILLHLCFLLNRVLPQSRWYCRWYCSWCCLQVLVGTSSFDLELRESQLKRGKTPRSKGGYLSWKKCLYIICLYLLMFWPWVFYDFMRSWHKLVTWHVNYVNSYSCESISIDVVDRKDSDLCCHLLYRRCNNTLWHYKRML